jgi:pimeloyl-ACP methyl ester carboxylesterase
MSKLPAFVIRGELSDVLSPETLNEMVERHPNLRTMTVPEQGHAPTLAERDQIEAIASFFAVND